MEKQNIMIHRLKNRLEMFSKQTTLHGFMELYSSKSAIWKSVWLIVVVASFGVTFYQVIEAVDQFFNRGSSTIIEIVQPERVYYPPLKLCLTHWLDWVDTERMRHYSFSKEAVLYGLSFLSTIYSNSSFDVQMAIRNFTEGMRINNFDTVTEFYEKIAHPIDDIIYMKHAAYFDSDSSVGIYIKASEVFKKTQMMFYYPTNFLCYVADGDNVIKHLNRLKQKGQPNSTAHISEETRNIFEFDLPDSLPCNIKLLPEEFNSYVAEYVDTTMDEYDLNEDNFIYFWNNPYAYVSQNYSAVKFPKILFVDGFSEAGITISADTDKYFVSVKATAHVWKNTYNNPCVSNIRFVVSNTTCAKQCNATAVASEAVKKNEDCFTLKDPAIHLSKLDRPTVLCHNELYILRPDIRVGSWTSENNSSTLDKLEYEKLLHQIRATKAEQQQSTVAESNTVEKMRKQCMVEHCRANGCEKWGYDISIRTKSMFSTVSTVASKTYTGIQIEYPLDGDILIMTEVDSQTWEDFVGNIGGLLGIWTGASILSFIQMVYLCCSIP